MDETTRGLSPAREDAVTEEAVLGLLLDLHPAQLTLAELVCEVSGGRSDFAATDPVERAVLKLSAAGLLNRNGEIVIPSRAALRFYELLD